MVSGCFDFMIFYGAVCFQNSVVYSCAVALQRFHGPAWKLNLPSGLLPWCIFLPFMLCGR